LAVRTAHPTEVEGDLSLSIERDWPRAQPISQCDEPEERRRESIREPGVQGIHPLPAGGILLNEVFQMLINDDQNFVTIR